MYLPDLLQFWSCQLISMCATACWEQLRPGRWQRKPVLTCSKFFELSQSQTEPGKFKTTTLLYNEVSHFNKQHYQLDQYCIKISPIIWTIMLWAQICFTLWLAATKQSNALCLWSIVFFQAGNSKLHEMTFEKSKEKSKTKSKTTWAHCCFWGFDLLYSCVWQWRCLYCLVERDGLVLEKDKQTNKQMQISSCNTPGFACTYKINPTCDPSWAAALEVEAMLG